MAKRSGNLIATGSSRGVCSNVFNAVGTLKGSKHEFFLDIAGAIPRKLPYKQGRWGPYVPPDVKVWRGRIANQCRVVGGPPEKGDAVFVVVVLYMKKSHADLDSCYHSIQDALSKDAWGISDKHWQHAVVLGGIVPPSQERTVIGICYA